MQRGFSNLKISEQAAVVAMRHDKMFSQGKRSDIIRELQLIDNPQLAENEEKTESDGKTTRDKIGDEYGLSGKSVSRLVRVSKLIDELKELVDSEKIAFLAAVQLSYLCEDAQETIALLVADGNRVNIKIAEQLRYAADEDGEIKDELIDEIICGVSAEPKQPKPKTVKISHTSYARFFDKKTSAEDVAETIEKALEAYFQPDEEPKDENPIPIEALNLSVDAYNRMKRLGVNQVSDFERVVKRDGLENLICQKFVREFMDKLNDYMVQSAQVKASNSDT